MPRKYQSGVPSTVDIVKLARGNNIRLYHLRRYLEGPHYHHCVGDIVARVAAKAHIRHSLLARMDAAGDKAIPAEILHNMFSFLCLGLEDRLWISWRAPFRSIDQLNDLIDEQFSHFPSSRLRRTAYQVFRKVMVFIKSDKTDLINGINARSVARYFGDQAQNIVNLCFEIELHHFSRDVDDMLEELGISLASHLGKPRFVVGAMLLRTKLKQLRSVRADLGYSYVHGTTPDLTVPAYDRTTFQVDLPMTGDYAPKLEAFMGGLQVMKSLGIGIELRVVWNDFCRKNRASVLCATEVEPGDSVEEVCKALLKPLNDGLQHTEDHEAYKEAEKQRCMSD